MFKVSCCRQVFCAEAEYLRHLLLSPNHYFPLYRAEQVAQDVFKDKEILCVAENQKTI